MYNIAYHHSVNLSEHSFLITGGAGFIGSNLVEYLIKFGAKKVRVLDKENILEFNSNLDFEIIDVDIRHLDTCRKALKDIDFVSQQAALGSVPRAINDPITTNDVNINGFLNVLVVSRDAQVKRVVYTARSSTYGDSSKLPKIDENIGNPLSPNAVTKYVNELYASMFSRACGFSTLGLRYFNIFGYRQNPESPYAAVIPLFIKAALQSKQPVIYGNGETTRNFTFVENVVQANMKAIFATNINSNEIFNIAYGKCVSLNYLWESICKMTDINLQPIYKEERKGGIKHSLADISKANKMIGYEPKISFEQGLQLAIEKMKHYTVQA